MHVRSGAASAGAGGDRSERVVKAISSWRFVLSFWSWRFVLAIWFWLFGSGEAFTHLYKIEGCIDYFGVGLDT